ncbi:hypothetical protein QBC34DRAFT_431809 [Podospora aff. communis PSN243]|uniref:Uncharacterized protein n=1 Tax=Podospora aff. communis PSN243 TaxID=3040156 RepID=A0AAV9G0N3_9PEZI|nr:hypothetical protein QBC34DRAFT_431809 [Podospora aff. communis PSN243]
MIGVTKKLALRVVLLIRFLKERYPEGLPSNIEFRPLWDIVTQSVHVTAGPAGGSGATASSFHSLIYHVCETKRRWQEVILARITAGHRSGTSLSPPRRSRIIEGGRSTGNDRSGKGGATQHGITLPPLPNNGVLVGLEWLVWWFEDVGKQGDAKAMNALAFYDKIGWTSFLRTGDDSTGFWDGFPRWSLPYDVERHKLELPCKGTRELGVYFEHVFVRDKFETNIFARLEEEFFAADADAAEEMERQQEKLRLAEDGFSDLRRHCIASNCDMLKDPRWSKHLQ